MSDCWECIIQAVMQQTYYNEGDMSHLNASTPGGPRTSSKDCESRYNSADPELFPRALFIRWLNDDTPDAFLFISPKASQLLQGRMLLLHKPKQRMLRHEAHGSSDSLVGVTKCWLRRRKKEGGRRTMALQQR